MSNGFDTELRRVVALAVQLPDIGNRFQLMVMLGKLAQMSKRLHDQMKDEYARGGKKRRVSGSNGGLIAAARALKQAWR